ncbi:dispatched -like protein [Brachionus plicatilis]|uniref:Dispatched-like protein n=1 Tax=Brachionus plicatilis TaxID=10195 RepID=A0A3M7Q8K7_BRAPC|nr:dispatched -like protein [Brachionus plicatilis]
MSYVREAPLSNEQMIRAMSGTLHHAASSIFVTSFTTAAAFMTNLITKLPVVQLFGFFTGSCIIVYFILVITVISAFVVTYEKYLQHFSSKLSCSKRLERLYERSIETMSQINQYVISERLPSMLFKLRALWFLVFLAVGCWGMYAVFVDPKLRPNSKWRYEFFQKGNKFENFEFGLRDQFLAYVNHEQRNMTNPEIFFVFGISNEDTGRVFDPDDDGHLLFDANFNFLSEHSQLWVNEFITKRLNESRHLFLSADIVSEWQDYLFQMQFFCQKILAVNLFSGRVELPFESDKLHRCQEKIKKLLEDSDLAGFENLMAAFPRRIIFVSNEKGVAGLILRVNANSSFFDFDSVDAYYHQLVDFQNKYIRPAPIGLNTGWFISVGFALYDLQNQLITGTYSSLVASMIIALVFLLLTSGNIFIAFYAITSISFSIAVTIAIFVSLGWELSILESVVIIMSVGLSVDFACHYGVAYINSDRNFPRVKEKSWWKRYVMANAERKLRIKDVFRRVGSAVLMAALTTFLAGTSMYPSKLTSFSKMGQFLMLVMCTSYLYATFMFVPLCAMFGPTHNFGNLNFRDWGMKIAKACYKKAHQKHKQADVAEERALNENVVSFSLVRAKSGE